MKFRTLTTVAALSGAVACAGFRSGPGGGNPGSAATTTGTAARGTVAATTTTTDPGTLPQTEDQPTASGPQWDRSVAGLWQAIVTDDPAAAKVFFFPLTAYRQVKAIDDPDADYRNRLVPNYEDDIHRLHRELGDTAAGGQLWGISPPRAPVWIKPGVENNKGSYWRTLDNELVVYAGAGRRVTVPVKSMISWRGEWYVVHLSSIR